MRVSHKRWQATGTSLLLILGLGTISHGAERSRDPFTQKCLFQAERQVTFWLHENCRVEGSLQACQRAVGSAMQVWNASACSDFQLVLGGLTDRDDLGANTDLPDRNINLILVVDRWLDERDESDSLTVTTYDRTSGAIFDVDVTLDNQSTGLSEVDLHNILVHEFGHTLGLAHTKERDSVLYPYYAPGTPRRSLSLDDEATLCRLYPIGGPTPLCDPDETPAPQVGCASADMAPLSATIVCLVLLSVLLIRRWRMGF